MSLRNRLTAVLTAVVVLPTIAAVSLIGLTLPPRLDAQLHARAAAGLQGDAAVLAQTCGRAVLAAEVLARRALTVAPAVAAAGLVAEHQAGWAGFEASAGGFASTAGRLPAGLRPGAPACNLGVAGTAAVVGRAVVAGRPGLTAAVVAVPAGEVAATLAPGGDRQVRLLATGRVVAAAGPPVENPYRVSLPAAPGRPLGLEVSVPKASYGELWAGLAAAAAVLGLIAFLLARRFAWQATEPLALLAAAAKRVTDGDLDTVVPVDRDDEVGRVGRAFNVMTVALRAQLRELADNRDELRRSVQRLGQTLSGTHDAEQILTVVLETALATTGARSGAVSVEAGGALRHRIVRGELNEEAEMSLAVPISVGDRTAGVLELHDKADGTSFSEADLEAVRALAGQAAMAMDNVVQHEEAQRLSVTDGLTGLWNRRFLNLALRREVERALRYRHPLAVLVIDIDRFKSVNDEHGHARGDAVLIEVAARLRAVVRETDVVSRPGGEEFVLVLPETGAPGAVRTCERICAAMREAPFTDPQGPPLVVTVSIGAALLPDSGNTPPELVEAADEALYAAKRGGRDGWRLAGRSGRPIRLDEPAGSPAAP